MPISLRELRPLALIGIGRLPDSPPTPAQSEANIRLLVWEMTWYGILVGTTVNFLQLFVVRLGAPGLLVSAITFGPALVSIVWQLPASRLMGQTGHRMRWVLGSLFSHRAVYLAIALLPIFMSARLAELTVFLLILQAIPLTTSSTSFLSMLADAVPPRRMPQVVGWRMAGLGLTSTLATLAAGRVLQWLPFPGNYQVLFIVGWLTSMVSVWWVSKLCVPDRQTEPQHGEPWGGKLHRVFRYPGYGFFVAGVGMLNLALGMIAPLLPLFWVRTLGATDGQISVIVTVGSGAMVVGSLLMRRAVSKVGRERALAAGALGYALYPLLTSLSPGVWWLIPWAALSGLFVAAIYVTLFDNLVAVTPDEDRTGYIAVFNIAANVALVAGPLIAGLLARRSDGLTVGLQVTATVALASGIMFALRRPR